MAAFIQRLFRNRKDSAPQPSAKKQEPPASDKAPSGSGQDEVRASQLAQLATSPTTEQLEDLAIRGVTADIRFKAAEQLEDREALARVRKAARNRDKGVYQTVRRKIQTIREQEEQEQSIREAVARVLRNAREQARSEDPKMYSARLEALLRHWKELEASATPEETTEFLGAIQQCRERLAGIQHQETETRRHKEQHAQRAETLALLEDTLQSLKNQEQDASLSALDALQKTQENRWLEATRDTQVEKQEQKQYESLMLTLRSYISALRQCRQHVDTLTSWQQQGHRPDNRELQDLIKVINWPKGFSKPALLRALEEMADQPAVARPAAATTDPEASKQLAKKLEQTLTQLEAALEARQLRESRQWFKTAQNQYRELDSGRQRHYQPRLQLLGGQLRELSDWQGFATEPKQISLCEQMEYLADQPMEPELKAEKIKELQNEWKALGGSSDRPLWNRFKAASDKAFEPCKEYFSAKSGLKQVNLQKRTAICDELAAFLDTADWAAVDWKQVERIHRVARQEWKEAWPVEFRDNRSVQKRFDALLKAMEKPLDEERTRNEETKQAIVAKAEALADHEPLQEAIELAKTLQQEWKAVGITRHRQDRKLWQAFRTACDAIFERRDARRDKQQEQARQADQQASAVLEQTRSVTREAGAEALESALVEIGTLQELPVSGEIQKQVRDEQQRLRGAQQQIARATQIRQWQHQVRARLTDLSHSDDAPAHWPSLADQVKDLSARELVIKAEILTGLESPEPDQSLRMELQVQRLANGLGGSNQEPSDPARTMEALVARWCLSLPGEELSDDKAERLAVALEKLPAA